MTKKNKTRNFSRQFGISLLIPLALISALLITACKNPLVGLGPRVDLTPPQGEVTGTASGDYVSGELLLTGLIEDDTDPKSVVAEITDPYDATVNESISGSINGDGTWDLLIHDTGDPKFGKDGQKNVIIVLTDQSDRQTELEMVFFFDNSAPVVMVTTPDLETPQDTNTFAVRGESYDPLGLASVTATINGPGSPSPTISANLGTPDSWYFSVEHWGTGDFYVNVTATDRAGNSSNDIFHATDLRTVNQGEAVTVIDLYNLYQNFSAYLFLAYIEPAHVLPQVIPLDSGGSVIPLPSGSPYLRLWDDADTDTPALMTVPVDMTQDIPKLNITSPKHDVTVPPEGDTMPPGGTVDGWVEDNVSIDIDTLQIRFMDTDGNNLTGLYTPFSTWTDVTETDRLSISKYNFNYTLPVFDETIDTSYTLEMQVLDNNVPAKLGESGVIKFFYDNNAPVPVVTFPTNGAFSNDAAIVFEGTAKDNEVAGVKVEISIDGDPFENVDTNTTVADGPLYGTDITDGIVPGDGNANPWSYALSNWSGLGALIVSPSVDTINYTIRATAGGSSTTKDYYFKLDRTDPVITVITPEFGSDVSGAVTLRVSVDDNAVEAVSRQIGSGAVSVAIPDDSLAYWTYTFSTYGFPDLSLVATETPLGSGLWTLPITIDAEDEAGNTSQEVHEIVIDNEGDRPTLSVLYPLNDPDPDDFIIEGGSFGGEVTVTGIANDDKTLVDKVMVRVDLNTTPAEMATLTEANYDSILFQDTVTLDDGIDFDGSGTNPAVTIIDESAEYEIKGQSSWSLTLNSTGELYNVLNQPGDIDIGHEGDIFMEIWAVDPDTATLTSHPQLYHIKMDNTLPRIENIRVNGDSDFTTNTYTGEVTLTADLSDNSEVTAFDISYNYGQTWIPVDISGEPDKSDFQISLNLNTTTGGGLVAGGNGLLYLKLRVTDDNDPQGYVDIENVSLSADNNLPEGALTVIPPTVIVLQGSSAEIQGTAADPTGLIAGIDRVEVYLESGGAGYDPHPTDGSIYNFGDSPDVLMEIVTFGAGNFYPDDETGSHMMIVDRQASDDDADGYDEGYTLSAGVWNWWIQFDSTRLPDGDLNVHYVVFDKAGNSVHYSQAARIENNPPVIASVDLGTDINYTADVNPVIGEGETFHYIDGTGTNGSGIYYSDFSGNVTGITVRNNQLYIRPEIARDAGNDPLYGNGVSSSWTWELIYTDDNPAVVSVPLIEVFDDQGDADPLNDTYTYTVSLSDFTDLDDASGRAFTIKVTDEADLSDSVVFLLNLDNIDDQDPTVTLDELNLSHNIVIDARDALANMNGYAVPGYDPDAEPPWESALGRLRSAGTDFHDGDDADASGMIVISGMIDEDKAIDSLWLTIGAYNTGVLIAGTGYDGNSAADFDLVTPGIQTLDAGDAFPLLVWDVTANGGLGGLKVADDVIGTPHISSESYGESGGHIVYWSFEFDTADIDVGAVNNLRVTAVATDKSVNSNAPVYVDVGSGISDDFLTMDVMPFVTNIVMSDASYASSADILRTKYGAWPIREGSYLKISGFNLGSIYSDAGTPGDTTDDYTSADIGSVASTVAGSGIPQASTSMTPFTGPADYTGSGGADTPKASTDKKTIKAYASGLVRSRWLVMETNSIPLMNYTDDFDENASGDDTWSDDSVWNDDRYLLVWDVADEMAGSSNAVWGAMDANPADGKLWSSWSEYSSATVYMASEDGMENNDIFDIYDPSEYTDIALNSVGTPYIVHLANFYGGNNWETGSGGLVLWGERAAQWTNDWGGWAYDSNPYGTDTFAEEIERFYQDAELFQFKNPKLWVTGDAALASGSSDIHVSYYDSHSKALKYAHFRDDGTSIYNLTFNSTASGADEYSGTNNKQYLFYNDYVDFNSALADTNIIAGDFTEPGETFDPGGPSEYIDDGSDMGLYSDITVDDNGYPVIVYYDTGNATLRVSRATSVSPTTHAASGGDWEDQNVLSNFSYVGKYPSVRVESSGADVGRIHITAYKVSTGDLMYYSAPKPLPADDDYPEYQFDIFEEVDGDGNMGAYADMDLFHDPVDDVYRPMIGYMNSSNVGTFQGLKFAYRKPDNTWEHGTVPLLNSISDAPVSGVGVPNNATSTDYSMALGFHSDSYRYAWLRPE